MTQPTTINMTFDTSLTEVSPNDPQIQNIANHPQSANISFSTTDSDPTETDLPPSTSRLNAAASKSQSQSQTPTPTPKSPTPVQHIPTQQAYDQWANVYDSDGNMLQAIDDHELETLLPKLLSLFTSSESSSSSPEKTNVSLIDLGCGTGRNTAKLLNWNWSEETQVKITGLDFSQGMLDIAEKKLGRTVKEGGQVQLRLQQCDCFPTATSPTASPLPLPSLTPVDAIISTLVLEHVPLTSFFATLAALVKNGGYALVTNMHSEMGKMSQAGFVNEQGVKVRAGTSEVYTVEETVEAAARAGFEVVSVTERGVEEEDLEGGVVGKRGRKWVGVKVWYGILLRRI